MIHAQSLVFVAAVMLATGAAASDIRRVVTGLDENNKAKVIFDSRLPLATGPYGINSTNLWITDVYPLGFSHEDTASKPAGISPPDNGTKFRVVEFAPLTPEIEQKMDPQFLMKAVGEAAPKRGLPVSHPMMHRTRSVDYAVVLSGEIDMVLDDSTAHLKPGDVIVQQATNHGWVNHGKEPCRMLFVLMDAKEPNWRTCSRRVLRQPSDASGKGAQSSQLKHGLLRPSFDACRRQAQHPKLQFRRPKKFRSS